MHNFHYFAYMLKTKLNKPNSNAKLILRKELIEKLEGNKERRLTLVSAPAGYGKSTTISQWIDYCNLPYSWYSIDKSDNDIVSFLQYIIAGIQLTYKNIGIKAKKLLASNNNLSFEPVAAYIINDLYSIKENFYIVLDDFHYIENNAINDLVHFFLENLPEKIQLVLITRSDPSIPIARFRSLQQLTEIRLSDLSFNTNTIFDFFKKSLNINLSIEDAHILATKTEGWVAGLQLTGLSLKTQKDVRSFIDKLEGNNKYIMDYLIEEVLLQQSPVLRDFLLNTSILKRFNSSLCNFVLDINNSQEIIENLERNNMFIVPLDSERNWYRYHHLFGQLLSNRLIGRNSKPNDLHQKASNWYEKNKMIEDAIYHSLMARDYKRSLEILNKISNVLWEKGNHSSLLAYGKLLPDDEIYKNPKFSLYYSWILIHSGKAKKAVPYLNKAESEVEKQLISSNDSKLLHELKGRIAVAQAFLHGTIGELSKIEKYSSIAMNYLSEANPLWYSWAIFTTVIKDMGLNNMPLAIQSFYTALGYAKKTGNIYLVSTIAMRLITCQLRMGSYVASFNTSTELLDYIKSQGFSEITKVDMIYSGLYTTLAMIHYSWGQFEKADEYIEIGYNLSLKDPNITNRFYGLFSSSFIYQGKENWKISLNRIKALEELMNKNTLPPHLTILYKVWKGYVLNKLEDTQKAQLFFTNNDITIEAEVNFFNEHAFVPLVYHLISIGDLTAAKKKLDEINELATKANRLERIIEVLVIYAIIYNQIENEDKAIHCIVKAMEVAYPEKIVLFFFYYLDDIKSLLQKTYKYLATKKHNIPKEYLDKLKSVIEKQDRKNTPSTDISKRELEILNLIVKNFSNQEIAENLFISIQTVKSHVKNILLKLDVANRHQAAHKAKVLGLV